MSTLAYELGDWIDIAPWKSKLVMLMFVPDDEYALDYSAANTVADKRLLLAGSDKGTVMAVWPGRWSTTARIITERDVPEVLARLG